MTEAGRFLCTAAVVGALLQPGQAVATETPGPPLDVQVTLLKPLRIGKLGLEGGVKVEIVNRSGKEQRVFHEDSNSLVFESVKDRSLHVVFHPCACMGNTRPSGQFSATLQPGGKKGMAFADWGCSGSMWRPPPPGTYDVTYRVFTQFKGHKVARHENPIPRCRADLQSPEYWKGAIVSTPIQVVIGRPKKRSGPGKRRKVRRKER
jgi:hypothetical protein